MTISTACGSFGSGSPPTIACSVRPFGVEQAASSRGSSAPRCNAGVMESPPDRAGRTGDPGAAQAAVAAWVLGQVLLMVVLSKEEPRGVGDLGGDRAAARFAQAPLIGVARRFSRRSL